MKAVFVACLLVSSCFAQDMSSVKTLCVTWPRGNSIEAQQSRAAAADRLKQLGNTVVDCWNKPDVRYDAQVWFYPYGGNVDVGQTDFMVTFAAASNVVVGSVYVTPVVVRVDYWMVSLWPADESRSLYRDAYARTVDQGLQRLTKALRKASKHGPK